MSQARTNETRNWISDLAQHAGREVRLRGWVFHLRILAKTSFLVLRDASGTVQCVAASERIKDHALKLEDVVEIHGKVRAEPRSKQGFEVDIIGLRVLNPAGHNLPFQSSGDLKDVNLDVLLEHRPLSLRNETMGDVFKIQAGLLRHFREYLSSQRFTEIISSKIVASGTEGGSNLFEIKYFDRRAYLAQSPQFYKEYGSAAFERVFETGHVYRAEPHATSRHLTEYYSLDLEFAFVDRSEDVIELERSLLDAMLAGVSRDFASQLEKFPDRKIHSPAKAPIWEFGECLDRLKKAHGRGDLVDDLDPEAERQICELARAECGVPVVFVVGFPLAARPFYVAARGDVFSGSTHDPRLLDVTAPAESFDLLYAGLEITTGGRRLHRRTDLEAGLRRKGTDPTAFEQHLRMYELGMPPHGGLAIGLERLTAQLLGLNNVRNATMFPRDRNRVGP